MGCIKAKITKIREYLNGIIYNDAIHIAPYIERISTHLNIKCTKVCDSKPPKWYPLLSDDGYVLYDINGVMLLAR